MTEGEFPFRSFTMREQGYDRGEVDAYAEELRSEITELRRALETATPSGDAVDARLHDPEGAVIRTLAIAQETADRVLHDAQVESDRRRAEADTHAATTIADADERAARLLGDMEAQAAEVREQGIAAARSAIQVERDKAMAELSHVRRVRDDLRTEAVELKTALDRYRSQAREASDTLASAASGPLMSLDLPDFIDDDVVLAGIVDDKEDASDDDITPSAAGAAAAVAYDSDEVASSDPNTSDVDDPREAHLWAVDGDAEATDSGATGNDGLADVIVLDADTTIDVSDAGGEFDDDSGTFLAEVRAAAVDDDVALAPENDSSSDRFLSELRDIADNEGDAIDSDAADTFFEE